MVQKTKIFGQKEVFEEHIAEAIALTPVPSQKKDYLEHRKSSPRMRQLKKVQIIFNDGFCTHNAILKDLSESGAKIELDQVLDIPNVFTLKFNQDNSTKKCALVWRGKNVIGARFIKPYE